MNEQMKAGLNAVKDFLSGRSGEAKLNEPDDQATREVVAAELLSAMSGRTAEAAEENSAKESAVDTQEIPRFEDNDSSHEDSGENVSQAAAGESSAPDQSESAKVEEQERARKLFLDHGYFDEAVEKLGSANVPAERVAAARALGLFGSQRSTPHLIAAMFDDDADVRSAAEEALAGIADPTVEQVSVEVEVTEAQENAGIATLPQSEVELPETVSAKPSSVVEKTPVQTSAVAEGANGCADNTASDVPGEESEMLREEQTIRANVEQLSKQLLDTIAAIKESENEVQWRIEREGQLRIDAAEKRREEEEVRKQAAEAAEARRIQENESIAAEQAARVKAETEAMRQAEEQTNLRLQAARLRLAAEELARRRAEMETARIEAQGAAREAEVARARDEARTLHEAALGRMRNEEESLRTATGEVEIQQASLRAAREKAEAETNRLKEEQKAVEEAQRAEAERLRLEAEARNKEAEKQLHEQLEELRRAGEELNARRAEAEASREKAEAEAERLVEAQARMRIAEDARAQAETERARIEAELHQQVKTQLALLEETRRRGEEELARVQEEMQRQAQAKEQRLADLAVMKAQAEAESKVQTAKEQQILSQVDSLRIADTETRRRIADAEVRRRATEDAYRVVAEKVQRVEAEAHARAKEEERIIAKLEAERRTVALEAQSRAEQEKRIKDEIEMFRRLEEQERPRIEEATLQLAAAEARLRERKEQLRQDEEARLLIERKIDLVAEAQSSTSAKDIEPEIETETTVAQVVPEIVQPADKVAPASVVTENLDGDYEATGADDVPAPNVTPAIANYLNSVDPYKRAAAVAELARAGGPDAFAQIVECFDDHSPHVRNAAARAIGKLEPKHTVDLFNRSLEGAAVTRRRNIGAAIAASGLAATAIENLVSENREDTYNALSILFVMAKTGEVHPLVQAIEGHESVQVRMAAIKLLTLTGQAELANAAAKRRLDRDPPEADYLT